MKNKKFKPSAIQLIFVLTICVIAGSFLYMNFLEGQYDSETKDTLRRETKQIKNNIDDLIDSKFERLNYLSEYMLGNDNPQIPGETSEIAGQSNTENKQEAESNRTENNENAENIFNYEQYISRLKLIEADKVFDKLGIADMNGNAYMTDGFRYDISAEEYYIKAAEGEKYISDVITDDKNEPMLIYSCPVVRDEQILGIIFGRGRLREIYASMDIANGLLNGQSCIVDKNGYIVVDNMFGTSSEEHVNIMDYLYDSRYDKQVGKVEGNYKYGYSDFASFKYDDDAKIFYAEHFDFNDWHLITMISKSEFSQYRDKTLFHTNILIGSFLVLYLATIFVIIFIQTKHKKNIERIAYVDELTGGNTYAKFEKVAEGLLKNVNTKYAVVDLDVDRFKYINDIFGYEEGNEVIQFISDEIGKIVGKEETYAHLAADEFVILLKSDDMENLISRIKQLYNKVSEKKGNNEKNYELALSIGIYKMENYGERLDVAIDMAKMTKKTIKGKHNQVYAVYDENMRKRILREQEIESMMEKSLKDEEFKVYYQPKYDAATCELVGAEALVRWYSATRGMVFPNEFIPVFENNGFITELDKYMFEHVCRDMRRWLDEGYKAVPVSVNLSQLQLYNTKFIEEYREILEKYNVPARYVQLELTETTLFSQISTINKIIEELHGIGFKILMDDFGTGYSSLSMLKNVPIDILKLDKSFVDDIGESKGDIVVSTIVSLGQLLDMKIVAEGVETQQQFEFLRDIFCDEIQGYYFSKPIAEEEYRKKMKKIEDDTVDQKEKKAN